MCQQLSQRTYVVVFNRPESHHDLVLPVAAGRRHRFEQRSLLRATPGRPPGGPPCCRSTATASSATCSVALEKSMTSTISIDPRFRGPPTSGNGGVSAGLAAAFVGESATVRIRKPPPLSAPMDVRSGRDGVEVVEGEYLILEAGPGTPAVEPPVSREILERTFERGTTAVPSGWPAPECFVCGPRADGLRICPQHLEGTELWTTVWTPDPSLSSDAETVDSHVVWGALDCPAGIAVVRVGVAEPSFFPALVELTAGDPPSGAGRRVADGRRLADRRKQQTC